MFVINLVDILDAKEVGGNAMTRLSSVIQLRITDELKDAIHQKANRLRLRPVDVMRYAIAKECEEEINQPIATGGIWNVAIENE